MKRNFLVRMKLSYGQTTVTWNKFVCTFQIIFIGIHHQLKAAKNRFIVNIHCRFYYHYLYFVFFVG